MAIQSPQKYLSKTDLKTGIDLRDEHMKKRIKERTISVKNIKASSGSGSGTIVINKVKKKLNLNTQSSDKTQATFSLNLLIIKLTTLTIRVSELKTTSL